MILKHYNEQVVSEGDKVKIIATIKQLKDMSLSTELLEHKFTIIGEAGEMYGKDAWYIRYENKTSGYDYWVWKDCVEGI